jgi:hypothetical protein
MKFHLNTMVAGLAAFWCIQAPAAELYVSLNCTNPQPPYTDWSIAATNIQDAINAANTGDLIMVSNGVYQTGGQLFGSGSNRVVVSKAATVQSVNGPAVTIIQGASSMRCAYVTNNAILTGFTLQGGIDWGMSGGGVYCASQSATVSNCVVVGNTGTDAGGIYSGTVDNCIIESNSASSFGGGGYLGTYNNCLLVGNSAAYGGAAAGSGEPMVLNNCTVAGNSASSGGGGLASLSGFRGAYLPVTNCIVVGNVAPDGSNYLADSPSEMPMSYCCTQPLPLSGTGNFTNDPAFVNMAGGNFHLQSNSPCINAGDNAYAAALDLDGNPRMVGGTVDIGAYEYQTPVSLTSYAWLQQYGLPIAAYIDTTDLDGTGFTVYQDWIAGLDPTNPASVLAMTSLIATNNSISGVTVSWQSVSNRTYYLQRCSDLTASFATVQSNLVGQAGTTSFTDTTATNSNSFFYRVGVQ